MREGGGKPNGLPPPSFFLFDSVLDHVDIEMVVGHLDAVGGTKISLLSTVVKVV